MSDNTNDINLISNKLNFKIIESGNIDLDSGRYKKIDCDSEQAMYISTFSRYRRFLLLIRLQIHIKLFFLMACKEH